MNEKHTHIDLCAGIGGFSIAFEAEGFHTIAYSEIDPDKILVYESHFPGVPNLGDMRKIVRGTCGFADVVTGGIPCQPASALGQMRGTADERWLWPEAIRLVGEIRPKFGVFENPPSILVLEGGRAWNGIVSGLVALGYDCQWDVFPAAAFGAGHLRERVILVITDGNEQRCKERREGLLEGRSAEGGLESGRQPASKNSEAVTDASSSRRPARAGLCESEQEWQRRGRSGDASCETAPNANEPGLEGHAGDGDGVGRQEARRPVATPDLRGRVSKADWWHEINTGVPVLAHGLPSRLVEAATRCAGDSVVPAVIQPIARAIKNQLTKSFASH